MPDGRPTTPCLRALADDGVRFDAAQAQAPWTRPSYTSMFTSRYNTDLIVENLRQGRVPAHRAGELEALQNPRGIPEGVPTLAGLLSARGYATVGLADNPNLASDWNFHLGFDSWDARAGVDASGVTRRALSVLDAHRFDERPLFLFVHYQQPHFPYRLKPPWDRLFAGDAEPVEDADWIGRMLSRNGAPLDDDPRFASPEARAALRRWILSQYDGAVAHMDDEIGRLLDALRARGLYDEALIVFNADHGDEFDDHGEWGHAHQLHRELLHVPLVVKWPASDEVAPATVATPVSNVDVAPTILVAAGVRPPPSMVGRDLHPHALSPDDHPWPVAAVGPRRAPDARPAQVAIRGPRHTLIRRYLDADLTRWEEFLFDLEQDPHERRPLPADASEGTELRRRLDAWVAGRPWPLPEIGRGGPGEAPELDPETLRRLEELGYAGDDG